MFVLLHFFPGVFHLNFVPGLCWRLPLQPRSLIYFTLGSYSLLWNLHKLLLFIESSGRCFFQTHRQGYLEKWWCKVPLDFQISLITLALSAWVFIPPDGKHYLLRKICVRYRQFRICQHKANTLIYGQQNVKTNIIATTENYGRREISPQDPIQKPFLYMSTTKVDPGVYQCNWSYTNY